MRSDTLKKRRAAAFFAAAVVALMLALTSRWWLPALPTLFGALEANGELIAVFADLTAIAKVPILLIGAVLAFSDTEV